MISLRRRMCLSVVALILAPVSSTLAQTTGLTGLGATGLGGSGGSGTGTSSGVAAPQITSPSAAPQTSQALSTSNVLNSYYANPYYQGRAGTQSTNTSTSNQPGGFGTALYGTSSAPSGVGGSGGFGGTSGTGTTGGGRTTSIGGSSGFGGTTGSFGSTTGRGTGSTTGGGFGGTTGGTTGRGIGGTIGGGGFGSTTGFGGTSSQNNNAILGPRAISYTAVPRFASRPVTTAQLTTDLRVVLDSSSQISSPSAVQVQSPAAGVVVLRGTVADEDEARLVEGMIRLTPGVREVRNELKFPAVPDSAP